MPEMINSWMLKAVICRRSITLKALIKEAELLELEP